MKLEKKIKGILFEVMTLDQVKYELLGYQVWFFDDTNKFYDELGDIPQGNIKKIMQVGKKREKKLRYPMEDAQKIYSINRKF